MSMGLRDFLLPFIFAWAVFWAIQYFFLKEPTRIDSGAHQVQSGQTFTVSTDSEVLKQLSAKPFNRTLDFTTDAPVSSQLTTVQTRYGSFVFSSDGACLVNTTFNMKELVGSQGVVHTINNDSRSLFEQCFLIGLDRETPRIFTLIEQSEQEDVIYLMYRAANASVILNKRFTIYKDICKIDVEIGIESKQLQNVQTRIFIPAPLISELSKRDYFSALVSDEKQIIRKIAQSKIDLQRGWALPAFFGLEDKYFVHMLAADVNDFVQRAYFMQTNQGHWIAILEGPETQSYSWKLSFYLGPKQAQVLAAVNPQLEQVLDYAGIFATISKWLLYFLNFLYQFLGNYGLAIIVMTVIMKLVMFPFTLRTKVQMRQRAEYEKKMAYLQHKYKDEPEILAREKAELLKKQSLSMLGGCLPLLLPLPVFFALSRVLSTSVEFYKAPFFGWIHDLSACDPYYVFPILVGLCMVYSALLAEPAQRMFHLAMALVLGAAAVNFSAGLSLYTFIHAFFSIIQQIIQNRMK